MFKVLGITDERSVCDCCGKSDLKRVVAIQNEETSVVGYYGTTCALNPNKCFGITKKDISNVEKEKKEQKIMYAEKRIMIKRIPVWGVYQIYLDGVKNGPEIGNLDEVKKKKKKLLKEIVGYIL